MSLRAIACMLLTATVVILVISLICVTILAILVIALLTVLMIRISSLLILAPHTSTDINGDTTHNCDGASIVGINGGNIDANTDTEDSTGGTSDTSDDTVA